MESKLNFPQQMNYQINSGGLSLLFIGRPLKLHLGLNF